MTNYIQMTLIKKAYKDNLIVYLYKTFSMYIIENGTTN